MVLVDGGVASSCPVDALGRSEFDLVIAVDVSRPRNTLVDAGKKPSLPDTLRRSWEVQRSIRRIDHKANVDLLITPDINALGFADTSVPGITRAVEAGYQAGKAALPALRRLLQGKTCAHVSGDGHTWSASV
jgi:predicted acylesterase/phospholipase RssA